MVNTNKIKGRIMEKNTTIGELSKKVPVTPYTLGKQISNKCKMPVGTAEVLANELGIPREEVADYFFVQ